MIDVDQLRIHEEQRLAAALAALDEAQKQLLKAMELVAARESECREIQSDVKRNLDAMEVVQRLASESAGQASQAKLQEPEETGLRMLPASSREDAETPQEREKSVAVVAANAGPNRAGRIFQQSSRFPFRNAKDNKNSILHLN